MRLRADDPFFRARLVYLGPEGKTLPVHLPYGQWGLTILCVVVLVTVGALIYPNPYLIGLPIGAGCTIATLLYRRVNPNRPVITVVRTLISDRRRITPAAADRLPGFTARKVIISKPTSTDGGTR